VEPILDEQRGVVEHHLNPGPGERLGPPRHLLADLRVDDGLQRPPLGRVGEDAPAELRPVQPSRGVHHAGEATGHLLQPRRAGLDDVAGHLVGVDEVGAELAEHSADGALSRAKTAREPQHTHQ
jgi:hypothetical protein